MNDDRLYLIHIGECIARIEAYTAEGREAFLQDTKTQDAVLRNLHTLSESAQRLSEELRETFSDVDWRGMIAFRNIVVHDYLGIDLARIWDIVARDIPFLKARLAAMLESDQT